MGGSWRGSMLARGGKCVRAIQLSRLSGVECFTEGGAKKCKQSESLSVDESRCPALCTVSSCKVCVCASRGRARSYRWVWWGGVFYSYKRCTPGALLYRGRGLEYNTIYDTTQPEHNTHVFESESTHKNKRRVELSYQHYALRG